MFFPGFLLYAAEIAGERRVALTLDRMNSRGGRQDQEVSRSAQVRPIPIRVVNKS